ncbi:MAG: flippase-like domain-containing protein [Chloroflexi bacterium]|nr:flippase-like domain-containing protein [Chloroflexota bacterium]
MRPVAWNIVKLGVTVTIIAFLFARVNLTVMAQHLAQANLALLLLALALYFSAILLGALKWHVLVRAQGLNVSLGELLAFSLVGLFFGNLLPSNVGGDVVRAYGLVRVTDRAEAAAISVLVDRLMGLVAWFGAAVLMAVLMAIVFTGGGQLEQIEIAIVIAAVLFIGAAALLFSRRVSQYGKWIFNYAPFSRVQPMAQRVFQALQVYRHSYGALAASVALSGSIVLVTTLAWYTVGVAVGVTASLFYFFVFNPLIAVLLLIPISFNGLGPKEAMTVFFFGLVGVPGEVALSMSLIFHLLIVLTSLPGGLLWWRGKKAGAPSSLGPL